MTNAETNDATHNHEDMVARYAALGTEWMAQYPVMNPPAGFELDPSRLGPGGVSGRRPAGWFLEDSRDETLHSFAEIDGGLDRDLAARLCVKNPAVMTVELWRSGDLVWAARRVEA